jgi:hypothetical protein
MVLQDSLTPYFTPSLLPTVYEKYYLCSPLDDEWLPLLLLAIYIKKQKS